MKISNSTTNLINQAYGNNTVHQNAANANAKSERNKETNPSANVDLSSRTKAATNFNFRSVRESTTK